MPPSRSTFFKGRRSVGQVGAGVNPFFRRPPSLRRSQGVPTVRPQAVIPARGESQVTTLSKAAAPLSPRSLRVITRRGGGVFHPARPLSNPPSATIGHGGLKPMRTLICAGVLLGLALGFQGCGGGGEEGVDTHADLPYTSPPLEKGGTRRRHEPLSRRRFFEN